MERKVALLLYLAASLPQQTNNIYLPQEQKTAKCTMNDVHNNNNSLLVGRFLLALYCEITATSKARLLCSSSCAFTKTRKCLRTGMGTRANVNVVKH